MEREAAAKLEAVQVETEQAPKVQSKTVQAAPQ
jgi:hypothetical protein